MAEFWITDNPAETRSRSARRFGTTPVNIGAPPPLDASTRGKLEAILSGSNEGDTIHFLPGTYYLGPMGTYDTDANLNPKSWKLFGSGMYTTTLKLVGCTSNGRHSMFTDPYVRDCDGMEIHDLTIDCDTTGQVASTITNQGISISGHGILCRRVRVINSGTFVVGNEVFPLQIFAYAGDTESNVVIDSCLVEQPPNDQLDGNTSISISPASDNGSACDETCVIQNSKVDYSSLDSAVYKYAHAFSGPTVRNNVAHEIGVGIYTDTWNHLIFNYHDNYLNVLRAGIDWNIATSNWGVSQSVTVERNVIKVDDENAVMGIRYYGNHSEPLSRSVPEVTVRNNDVDMRTDLLFSGLRVAGAYTASISENIISRIDFYNVGTSSVSGNLDREGNAVNATDYGLA